MVNQDHDPVIIAIISVLIIERRSILTKRDETPKVNRLGALLNETLGNKGRKFDMEAVDESRCKGKTFRKELRSIK